MRSKFKDEHPFGACHAQSLHTQARSLCPSAIRETQGGSRTHQTEVSRSHSGMQYIQDCYSRELTVVVLKVICEKADRTDIPTIDKKKYLVPSVCAIFTSSTPYSDHRVWSTEADMLVIQDLTVGQFVYVIRKRIKLAPEKAIFIFVDEILPPTAALMSAIYEEHKYVVVFFVASPYFDHCYSRDEDNFLYVSYSGENTFGQQGWVELSSDA